MIRHRRNNGVAGVTVLVGALLVAFGALRPWARVEAALGIKAGALDLNIVPNVSADKGELQAVVLVLSALVGVAGLLLIATRVRGLGVFWRLFGLVCLLGPGVLAYYLWTVVLSDDPGAVLNDPNAGIADKLAAVSRSLLQRLGVVKLVPGQGLYFMTAGVGVALIGFCIPAMRTVESIGTPANHLPVSNQQAMLAAVQAPPPGWYQINERGDRRYWDGRGWS